MIEKMKIESDDGFLHLEDLPHNRIFILLLFYRTQKIT